MAPKMMRPFSFVCTPTTLRSILTRKCVPGRHRTCRRTTTSATAVPQRSAHLPPPLRIVCIGDIHSLWDEHDESALRNLKPDLVLFVGDYGNEDMRVTRRIADFASAVNFNVATVFGNHDAFYTASALGRKNAPYDKNSSCRVTEQMEMLAPFDVSYRSAAFDDLSLCVCGGRSFSWGGPHWKHREFYRKYIGIHGMTHSTSKMVEAVTSSKFKTVMFLSHSGPTGLGDEQDDPCGRDWGSRRGGDYGDQDLRYAIETARKEGLRVPLTVFGHMHKRLYDDSGDRTMLKTEPDGTSGGQTVMLNAAVCPRQKTSAKTDAMLSHFQIVQLGENGYVLSVEEAWVTPAGDIEESTPLFDASQQAIPIRESAVVQEVVQEIL